MTNLNSRLARLEQSRRGESETLAECIAYVLEHPTEAAAQIGGQAVRRVFELVEIARARKEAANDQP